MLALLLALTLPTVESPSHPNVILLLVDDLGWTDLGVYGSDYYRTPNIDRLAASGMRFTQAYAACPVCSPTRASILTGRHPVRVDVTDWLPGMQTSKRADARFEHVDDRDNLALEEVTLAERLADDGYARWFLGKWHLGEEGHWPTDQGFEVNIGGHHKGSPPGGYYSPWKNPVLKSKAKGEYLTERLTDEAVALMKSHREQNPEQPFFMDLSYYNVHTPLQPYKKRVGEYEQAGGYPDDQRTEHDAITMLTQGNPTYASMVAAVDDSVGQILDALEATGMTKSTYVIFFSDNGGLSTQRGKAPTSNEPLRAGKGWLYEGGIREPLIIAGPGIEPGVTDAVAFSTDLFPTVLELTGLEPSPELAVDGRSLVQAIRGEEQPPRDLFWHYPHYHGSLNGPGSAIRSGDWKLIVHDHYDEVELYNLADDLSESNDLAEAMPAKRDELLGKLRAWQREMNAKMPVPKFAADAAK